MVDNNSDNEDYFNPEEEVDITGKDKPNLPSVDIKTGEEDEECIFKMRARLYRWRNSEWKERGTGEAKLLRHKENKKIRFVLRQDKTHKPVGNFFITEDPLCLLKEHQGSDKMFFFTAYDCSEEPFQIEKLVLKLGNANSMIKNNSLDAAEFKKAFEDAKEFNKAVKHGGELKYAPVVNEKDEEDEKEIKKEEKSDKKEEKAEEKTEEKTEEKADK